MKIAISAESTIDLTKELLNEYDIHTIPFTVSLGNKEGLDGEITSEEIINFVSETNQLPKTSAVNSFQYTEHFEKLLKEYDAIIHLPQKNFKMFILSIHVLYQRELLFLQCMLEN